MKTRETNGDFTVTGVALLMASVVSAATFIVPVLYLVNGGNATAVLDRIDAFSTLGKFLVAALGTAVLTLWAKTALMILDIDNSLGGFRGWLKARTGCDCPCRIISVLRPKSAHKYCVPA